MTRRSSIDDKFTSETLQAARVLQGLDDGDLHELVRCAKPVAITAGKPIAATGLGDHQVILVHEGVAAATRRLQQDGRAALAAFYGRGDVAVSPAIFSDQPASDAAQSQHPPLRTLIALTNVSGHAIRAADFLRIIRRNPDVAAALMSDLALRLDTAEQLIAQSVFRPLEIRLASFFSHIVRLYSPDDWNPVSTIGHISQAVIADMHGVSREHVNRTLTMWERSGLIFLARNGALTVQNRKRLTGLAHYEREPTPHAAGDDWLWEIDSHLDCGLNKTAYHLAIEAAKRTPRDLRFRHRAVLATARSGGPQSALEEFEKLGLGKDLSNEDTACLRPRLQRDLAWLAGGDNPNRDLLRESAEGYENTFLACDGYYSGVNAAAGYALLGDTEKAGAIAKKVKAVIEERMRTHEEDADEYFIRASLAECALISGDIVGAASLFQHACTATDVTAGKKATTRKQLKRLAAFSKIDDAWINSVAPQGKVIFYSGPLVRVDDHFEEELTELKYEVLKFLASNSVERAFGALASGADIVVAEAMLEAGVDLSVYLPMPPAEFLRQSVRVGGDNWRERFFLCMRRAATVGWNAHATTPTSAAFILGAEVAMGKAINHAQQLDAEAFGFFSAQKEGDARTSISLANIEMWRERGLPFKDIRGDWSKQPISPAGERIEEKVYFSVILEKTKKDASSAPEMPSALSQSHGAKSAPTLYLFRSPSNALSAAIAFAEDQASQDWRIWLDAAALSPPTSEGPRFSDISKLFVTTTCMPSTEPGAILASDLFVGAAHASGLDNVRFEYAGFATTREKVAPCPLYLLAS